MITPVRILNKYREVERYLPEIRNRVRPTLLALCDREGFALEARIKKVESVCEKVETGRYSSWSEIDDLVAFAIVVPKLSNEESVVEFLADAFQQVALRPRGSSRKSPEVFRFDATRFIGRLRHVGGDADAPLFEVPFEIQVRSAFEHAWSVTTHALTYKSAEVSWSKLRLTAQLKSAVEQLDTLVSAFDDAADYIKPSAWPEIDAKSSLKAFFEAQVESGLLPIELTPKDWSRFVDNVYSSVSGGAQRVAPGEISRRICEAFAVEVGILGRDAVPTSISLWQLTFASVVKSGSLQINLRDRWPLITPELEALYPVVAAIGPRFDYA